MLYYCLMKKHNGLYKDIVGWDVVNWGKFVDFIYQLGFSINGKKVLDIGARDGGMSLLFALDGAEVVCSDLDGPTDDAAKLHQKYEVSDKITYAKIDATKIPKEYYGTLDYSKSGQRNESRIFKNGGYGKNI